MNNSNQSRILIVDDNPFNRTFLKGILAQEVFIVDEAANGKEAVEHVKKSVFQMIFMDLLMPGMDGFETIRKIRRMGVTTPIIIVSAMSSKEDRQKCLEAGGDDFLPKPIEPEKLKAIIKKYEDVTDQMIEPSMSSINFADYRILLVEEDERLANRFKQLLIHFGFDVTRVSNGNQAWALFTDNQYRYHILISNMFTSGIDGLGILARIKREFINVLVFIYAREYDREAFQLALQLGAEGVITEDDFKASIIDLIESAIFQAKQKGSRVQAASTVRQVRRAQAQLIKFGCLEPCNSIDIAYSPLSDAGGDIASCRHFNLAGRCGIVLGDVSGHNVMSSYVSAFFLGLLSSTWNKHQKPLDLLKNINIEFNKASYEDYHLCASALLWDRCRRKIKQASAGNPGALLVENKQNGMLMFNEIEGGGMCLGLLSEDHLFVSNEIEFNHTPRISPLEDNTNKKGETYLFLFSDGISKSQIVEILFSGNVNLNRQSIRGLSQEILDRILEKWGQEDDMILIALKHSDKFRDYGKFYAFQSSYKEVDKACKWVADQCISQQIPKGKDPCLVQLAVREALLNAVRHGNRLDPTAFVDLSLYFEPGELRIEISDQGPGFEIPMNIQKIENINILQSGGRGLPAMYSIADILKVDGGTVTLKFFQMT